MKIIFLLFTLLILAAGCADEDTEAKKAAEAKKAHAWKEQTETMDKARAVEGVLQDSADAAQKQIEDQSQ